MFRRFLPAIAIIFLAIFIGYHPGSAATMFNNIASGLGNMANGFAEFLTRVTK